MVDGGGPIYKKARKYRWTASPHAGFKLERSFPTPSRALACSRPVSLELVNDFILMSER